MCFAGVATLRVLLWVIWVVLALPFRLIETVCMGIVAEYLSYQIKHYDADVKAYLVLGVILSCAVFLPMARMDSINEGILCTTYLSSVAWVMGNVCMNFACFYGLVGVIRIDDACPCLVQGIWRLRIPNHAGYIGLLLGISFAFPVATMYASVPGVSEFNQGRWCRPHPDIAAEFVYVPLFITAMMAANIDTSPERIQNRERHQQATTHSYHTVPAAVNLASAPEMMLRRMRVPAGHPTEPGTPYSDHGDNLP